MRRLLLLALMTLSLTMSAQTPPSAELTIWLPDALANFSTEALSAFGTATDDFAAERSISALIRIKKVSDAGGILSTLRSASSVAPRALPSVTLLRRSDLLLAAQERLIEPLPPLLIESAAQTFSSTRRLCEVSGVLMGVPFLVDLQHFVYLPQPDVDYTGWRFEDVLARGLPMQFAGNANVGVNPVLYVQYLAAGGSTDEQGILQYDAVALRQVLEFYEAARAAGIIDEQTLLFTSPLQYGAALATAGERQWGALASQYLRALAFEPALRFAPVPTSDGTPRAVLEGWCWVLVTRDDRLQPLALDYIDYMSGSSAAVTLAEAIRLLPPQMNLLAEVLNDEQTVFYTEMLANSFIIPLDAGSIAVERAIQDAFRAVINGSSAEEAVRAASASLGG
jgi:ABC-type glycerol-3-phosphate transport system substrate-binding protein